MTISICIRLFILCRVNITLFRLKSLKLVLVASQQ